ncbi:hypothetical protein IMSAGC011_01536 [Lachnospiraceae bacterium]|nr:hypothetical protein IMSAGC011_01536 [Lachnospiraceae bacterium]
MDAEGSIQRKLLASGARISIYLVSDDDLSLLFCCA